MNQPFDNGNDNDPTLDRLLQQAFASRNPGDGRASLIDVRHRARRRQRRRAGAMVGAAAIVGAGGVAVLTRGGNDATTTAGDSPTTTAAGNFGSCSGPIGVLTTDATIDGLAATTSFQIPGQEATTTTDPDAHVVEGTEPPSTVVPTGGTLTTGAPTTAFPTTTTTTTFATTTLPADSTPADGFATTTGVETPAGLSGCLPPGAFRCSAPLGSDDQGFTYYAFCEPADGGWTAYPTTTIDPRLSGGIVIVDSSGGLDGATDNMVGRITAAGLGPITVVAGTRPVEQTMLMPTGDRGGLDIVRQLTGIDGFDTWSSGLIDGPLPTGTLAVVVIGQDYWTRATPTIWTTTTSITG